MIIHMTMIIDVINLEYSLLKKSQDLMVQSV
jgi:hypothetical protein